MPQLKLSPELEKLRMKKPSVKVRTKQPSDVKKPEPEKTGPVVNKTQKEYIELGGRLQALKEEALDLYGEVRDKLKNLQGLVGNLSNAGPALMARDEPIYEFQNEVDRTVDRAQQNAAKYKELRQQATKIKNEIDMMQAALLNSEGGEAFIESAKSLVKQLGKSIFLQGEPAALSQFWKEYSGKIKSLKQGSVPRQMQYQVRFGGAVYTLATVLPSRIHSIARVKRVPRNIRTAIAHDFFCQAA